MSTLASSTARNISYVGISQLLALVLNLATIAILARLLTAEDFGIVGIGLILLALFYSIQDVGIASAVIQRDTRVEESISVGLALRWIIAAILAVIVVGIYPLVAAFFLNESIPQVLLVMTLNLFILTVGFPAQTLLTRDLRFGSLAVSNLAQSVAYSCVAILTAVLGFAFWSIVLGSLSGSIVYVAVLKHYEGRRFWPVLDIELMRELIGFGRHLLVVVLMVFIIFNLDQVVVARVISISVLGFYVVAIRFGRTLGDQIAATVNKVLFPTMARVKGDIILLRTGYIESLRMISIVAIPLSVGLSALSPVFVEVVLGPKWSQAAIPLAILCFQGLFNALVTPASNILISIGKPRYMSIQSTIQAIALVVAIVPVAVLFGINGVCMLTTILSFCVLVYFLFLLSSLFGIRLKEITGPILSSSLSGALTFLVLMFIAGSFPRNLTTLLGLSALGAMVYAGCLYMLSGGKDFREPLGLLREALRLRKRV